jgi:hypothetical protein
MNSILSGPEDGLQLKLVELHEEGDVPQGASPPPAVGFSKLIPRLSQVIPKISLLIPKLSPLQKAAVEFDFPSVCSIIGLLLKDIKIEGLNLYASNASCA